MSTYRIRITTCAKVNMYGVPPDHPVYIVQQRFCGFLWRNIAYGHSEMWARCDIASRHEVDAKRKAALSKPDLYIGGI